jgi:hypothetical protein
MSAETTAPKMTPFTVAKLAGIRKCQVYQFVLLRRAGEFGKAGSQNLCDWCEAGMNNAV